MSAILFVLGPPGVGKTTLVRNLLASSVPLTTTRPPDPKWTHVLTTRGTRVAAGHYKGETFDGADTVPYSGAGAALDYWAASFRDSALTIFDGARFSTRPSLERLRELAPDHRIIGVHLIGEGVAEQRRERRGTEQNASWVKGAITRAKNFAELIGAARFDATVSADKLYFTVEEFVRRTLDAQETV